MPNIYQMLTTAIVIAVISALVCILLAFTGKSKPDIKANRYMMIMMMSVYVMSVITATAMAKTIQPNHHKASKPLTKTELVVQQDQKEHHLKVLSQAVEKDTMQKQQLMQNPANHHMIKQLENKLTNDNLQLSRTKAELAMIKDQLVNMNKPKDTIDDQEPDE